MWYNQVTGELTKAANSMLSRSEEVIDNFWNVLEHPDFPFITLTSTTNGARNFPPYNMVEIEEGTVRLELAVAGYTKERLTVEKEGNVLIVQGTAQDAINRAKERPATETVRHQGIRNAQFVRAFDLNPTAIIQDVQLKDGILSITVVVPKPKAEATPRTTFDIK